METDRIITASCLITRNKVFKNGRLVFEKPGAVESFLDECYTFFAISYPKFHKMDKLCKLGLLAAEILLKGMNHDKKYGESDTGLILSNANASLDVDLRYEKTMQSGASPALFVYTLPNIVIGEISIRHRFKGENAFFVFKHFDGNFMAEYINGLFDRHLIKTAICGWVEILKENYRAQLFLIEKDKIGSGPSFNADNLHQLNQQENG